MISVIVPTRNRAANLPFTLEALSNQSLDNKEYEIIISDDNSNDETFQVWKSKKDNGGRWKYVNNNTKPHSWNASVPRNLGALVADPESVGFLFVDSDVVLGRDALKNIVEDYQTNPDRVVIGPYDFYDKGNERIKVVDVRSDKFATVKVEDTFNTVHDGLACFGGNLFIPKGIFWSVMGFSVDTHIGLEDGDMGLKLWKKETKFSYDARNRGKHLWHETPSDRFPPNMKDHIDSLNLKHFGTKDPDYGIIEASREAYEKWGITGWNPPPEWGRMGFGLQINKDA